MTNVTNPLTELKTIIADELKLSINSIKDDQDLTLLGMDSMTFFVLIEKINYFFNRRLSADSVYDNFTPNGIIQLIAGDTV